jgi:hypothetical protein
LTTGSWQVWITKTVPVKSGGFYPVPYIPGYSQGFLGNIQEFYRYNLPAKLADGFPGIPSDSQRIYGNDIARNV